MKRGDEPVAGPATHAAAPDGLPDGLPTRLLNPAEVHVHAYTYAGGLAAVLGHDLKLVAREPRCRVAFDHQFPVAFELDIDARHVVVDCVQVNGRDNRDALEPRDRAGINACIQGPSLDADNHPVLRFVSGRVSAQRDALDVVGRLSIKGHTHALHLRLVRSGDHYTGRANFHLPHYAIEPQGRFLGLSRVKPDAVLEISLPVDMGAREYAAGVKPV